MLRSNTMVDHDAMRCFVAGLGRGSVRVEVEKYDRSYRYEVGKYDSRVWVQQVVRFFSYVALQYILSGGQVG